VNSNTNPTGDLLKELFCGPALLKIGPSLDEFNVALGE